MDKAIIVGAGGAGQELLAELRKASERGPFEVIGFVDDDEAKQGRLIHGVRVLGRIDDLPSLLSGRPLAIVFIAMPSTSGGTIRRAITRCQGFPVRIKIVPRIAEIINGVVDIDQVRDIQVEDVLGRAVVRQDFSAARERIRDRSVMVFGAAGSIGSELCSQIAGLDPRRLVCVDCWENGIFELEGRLHKIRHSLETTPLGELYVHIGNIQNEAKVEALFAEHRPDVVFNAAAYKHVPLMEFNPAEAVENNIGGTRNLFEAAVRHGTGSFVLISSDKAVNPTNVMGATKRVTERMMHGYSRRHPGTNFSAVRFGNVLNSSGSVIPTFKRQIREGVVTVTHPDIVRYFMTVQEAVQLVIQCWLMSSGDDIFVLDMGDPVRIVDLAELMIRLSGLEPGRDVRIEFTGLRPGEKLYEEPLTKVEQTTATRNDKVFIVTRDTPMDDESFMRGVRSLIDACAAHTASPDVIRAGLRALVPTYREEQR